MRLWHQDLIQQLPRQQLLGQHREIAALRGNGWGRKHATVNYVFAHSPYKLFQFHCIVLREMEKRGYHPDQNGMILCIEVNIAQHTNNSIRLHSQYPSILSMTNDINMFA